MGKMKREWESLVEQGDVGLGLGSGVAIEHNKYAKLGSKDEWNLWDTDDRGDNRVDMDRLWEAL
jgi:hypothetical protein